MQFNELRYGGESWKIPLVDNNNVGINRPTKLASNRKSRVLVLK